jgi:hypothetical protein
MRSKMALEEDDSIDGIRCEVLRKILLAARQQKPEAGSVYFVQQGELGPIKIGFSKSVKTRLADLQTANPHKLRLLYSHPGDEDFERLLHTHLNEHRLQGEWFKPSDAVARVMVALAQGCDTDEHFAALDFEEVLSHAWNKTKWEVAFTELSGSKYLEPIVRRAARAIVDETARTLTDERHDCFWAILIEDARRLNAVLDLTHALDAREAKTIQIIANCSDFWLLSTRICDHLPSDTFVASHLQSAAAGYLRRHRKAETG